MTASSLGSGRVIDRLRMRQKLIADQNLFEANCIIAEDEFQRLDMIMEYEDSVEPCKYTFYLALGCFNAVMSILFMIHVYKHILMKVEGKTSDPFLD